MIDYYAADIDANERPKHQKPRWISWPLRIVGVPFLIAIYFLIMPPFALILILDWLFDVIAKMCDLDTRGMGMPFGDDEFE